jgi:hypothetical protein
VEVESDIETHSAQARHQSQPCPQRSGRNEEVIDKRMPFENWGGNRLGYHTDLNVRLKILERLKTRRH